VEGNPQMTQISADNAKDLIHKLLGCGGLAAHSADKPHLPQKQSGPFSINGPRVLVENKPVYIPAM
jgi:hypothetical protein